MTRSSGRSAVPRVGIIFRRISNASDWSLSGNGIERIKDSAKEEKNLSLILFFFFYFFEFCRNRICSTRGKINST